MVNFSLKGIQRLKGHCVKQAAPITPELLFKIYQVLDMADTNDVVYWCLFLFAFFLLARKSNLVITTLSDLALGKCLVRDNVKVRDNHLEVTMNWTKTIQFGERSIVAPLIKIKNSVLCPYTAYMRMIKVVKADKGDPLFVLNNGKPVSYYLYQKKLRSLLDVLQLDSSLYSSHSFRRGFATFAFRHNISADNIQILGDWRSEAYKRYISLSVEDKLDIFKGLHDQFVFH